MLIRCATASA